LAPVASLVLLVLCFALIPGQMRAQVIIDLPNKIPLLPNTAGQSFEVYLLNSGDPMEVNGMIFNIQVADGGPELGKTIRGPAITSVDIFTGTVFASNNDGPRDGVSIAPQLYMRQTMTLSDTVSLPHGESKVATVYLDTTGFDSGEFTLTLNTLNGPTRYTTLGDDFFPEFGDGGSVQLTVVPEPGVWAVASGIGLMLFAGLRKARGRRQS